MDVWYVENHSLLLDLRIMLKTLRMVLSREGINQPGHPTREPFRGSAR
jgi:sugar transferase EpsL